MLEQAEHTCADEVIAANFVRPTEVSAVVSQHPSELAARVYFVQGRFEERCFIAGIESEVSVDLLDPFLRWVNGEFEDPLDRNAADQRWRYHAAAEDVANICLSPFAGTSLMLSEVDRTVELCDEDGRYAERWRDCIQNLQGVGYS